MVEVYSLVLFVHVVAAAALIGHSLGSPVTRAALRDAESLRELRRAVAFERRVSRRIPLVALALLATGIYLGSVGWWYQEWFYVSIAAWVVNSVLAAAVLKPALGALMSEATAAGEGSIPAKVDGLRRSTRLAAAMQAMLANNLALLFIMLNRPSLLASVAALALANLVLVGYAVVVRRARASAAGASATAAGLQPDNDRRRVVGA